MTTLLYVTKRNIKLFFKDKGLFFVSLITPAILLVLFVTFLGNVYRNSFIDAIHAVAPDSEIDGKALNALVGGQLVSSLLSVCCVTVAFCSNMIMAQDKSNGIAADFAVSPVKRSTLALGYYLATFVNTMIVSLIAAGASFIYLAITGWALSFADVMLILLDVTLLVFFGTAISSAINFFLSSQGQISAVGSLVSSMYGFLCGAYMPLSQFPETLQKIISLLPGTYGTSLLRNHCMRGALQLLKESGADDMLVNGIKQSVDCEIHFFGAQQAVPEGAMFAILIGSIVVLIGVYVLFNVLLKKKK